MLRNDRQLALNRLLLAGKAAADRSRAAAEMIGDAQAAAVLGEQAGRLERLGAALEADVRALGDLPMEPDPERETLENLLTRLRGALSGDLRASVLHELEAAERELAEAVAQALALDWPADTGSRVRAVQDALSALRERLAELRQRRP